jgi:probable F420-dependent oxidoreductase
MIEAKVGIFLPTFWSDYGSRSIARAMREVGEAAVALGFDSVWACDHIVAPQGNAGSARCLEPLILMSGLAQQFPTLLVGTDVLVLPQRNAILVAKQAATLSVLSGGRLILGIGAGWNEAEFRLVGADFERRGAHTDEAIRLMKTLWRQTPAAFDGAFYQLQEAYFYPDPSGDGPPIWVGGASKAALARAARLGDGWMPFWGKWDAFSRDLDLFRRQTQQLRASERGQAIRIAANVPLRIATGSDEHATDTPQPMEQITAALRAYRDAGLETVIWNIQSKDMDDYLQQMRLAAEQILPFVS